MKIPLSHSEGAKMKKVISILCVFQILLILFLFNVKALPYESDFGITTFNDYDSRNLDADQDRINEINKYLDLAKDPQIGWECNHSSDPLFKIYVIHEIYDLQFDDSIRTVENKIWNADRVEYVYEVDGKDFSGKYAQFYIYPSTHVFGTYEFFDTFYSKALEKMVEYVSEPQKIFSSVACTENKNITVNNLYCFSDRFNNKYIYFDTSDGAYICFLGPNQLEYLMPLETFEKISSEYISWRNNLSGIDHNLYTSISEGCVPDEFILDSFEGKENLAQYVLGGITAINEKYPKYKFLEEKTTAETTEQPTQVQDSDYLPSAPTDKSDQDDLDVYKILFIAESAIVSCCLLCFVIYKLVKIKKKE